MKQISCLSKSSGEEWSGREKEVNRCSFLPQGRRRKKEDFKVTHQAPLVTLSCVFVVALQRSFVFRTYGHHVRIYNDHIMTTYMTGPCGSRRRKERKKEDPSSSSFSGLFGENGNNQPLYLLKTSFRCN